MTGHGRSLLDLVGHLQYFTVMFAKTSRPSPYVLLKYNKELDHVRNPSYRMHWSLDVLSRWGTST